MLQELHNVVAEIVPTAGVESEGLFFRSVLY